MSHPHLCSWLHLENIPHHLVAHDQRETIRIHQSKIRGSLPQTLHISIFNRPSFSPIEGRSNDLKSMARLATATAERTLLANSESLLLITDIHQGFAGKVAAQVLLEDLPSALPHLGGIGRDVG